MPLSKPRLTEQILAVAQEAFLVIPKFPACSCTEELKEISDEFILQLPSPPPEYAPHPNYIAMDKVLLWSRLRHIGGAYQA